jgi:hypothetical protein
MLEIRGPKVPYVRGFAPLTRVDNALVYRIGDLDDDTLKVTNSLGTVDMMDGDSEEKAPRTILQWNADQTIRSRSRGLELENYMVRHRTAIVLLQEGGEKVSTPLGGANHVFTAQIDGFHSGRASVLTSKRVTQALHRPDLSVTSEDFDACVVDVCIDGVMCMRVISAYRSVGGDQLATSFLDWISTRLSGSDQPNWPVLLGCDANIHSRVGMDQKPGPLGRTWDSLLRTLEEEASTRCLNQQGTPTWTDHLTRRLPRTPSAIDYSVFYPGDVDATVDCTQWKTDGQSASDHQRILITLAPVYRRTGTRASGRRDRMQRPRWESQPHKLVEKGMTNDDGDLDSRLSLYSEHLAGDLDEGLLQDHGDPDVAAAAITLVLQKAAIAAGFLRLHAAASRHASPLDLRTYGWDTRCTTLSMQRGNIEESIVLARRLGDPVNLRTLRHEWSEVDRQLDEAIAIAKRSAWRQSCSKLSVQSPVSEAFSLIHRLSGAAQGKSVSGVPPLATPDGGTAFTPDQQAELLSVHWEERSSLSHSDNDTFDKGHYRRVEAGVADPSFFYANRNTHPLSTEANEPFTASELEEAVMHIRGSAPGRDGLHRNLLRWGFPLLGEELLRLYNLCLEKGRVPATWKIATVIPLPKVARPRTTNHFRGISLLAVLGKVLEHLLKARLTWILLFHKASSPCQTAYTAHRSTVHQLLRIVDAAKGAWHRRCHLVFVSFDISRAFDTVWHAGLLHRLKSVGVTGNLLRLFASFLDGRGGRVRVGASESSLFPLALGVPQGSVLGPLLWNTYFDHIGPAATSDAPSVSWGAFADDLGMWVELPRDGTTRESAAASLQTALDATGAWSLLWRLAFDVAKTQLVVFNPRGVAEQTPSPLTWTLLGRQLVQCQDVKVLGVCLDSGLTFANHIKHVYDRTKLRINVLRSVSGTSWGGDTITLLTLYQCWIRPVMEYASPVWALSDRKGLRKLDILQNEALRIVLHTPTAASLATLHWDTQSEYLALRRVQAGGRLACSLDRLPHSSACAMDWRTWQSERTVNLRASVPATNPVEGYRLPHSTSLVSPFRFLWIAKELLSLRGQDPVPERFEHGNEHTLPPPWHPPLPSVLTSICPNRPKDLGSANRRTPAQLCDADKWTCTIQQTLNDSALRCGRALLVAYTDGPVSVSGRNSSSGGIGVAWTYPDTHLQGDAVVSDRWHRIDYTESVPGGKLVDIHLMEMGGVLRALQSANQRLMEISLSPSTAWLAILVDCISVVEDLTSMRPSRLAYEPYWQLRALIEDEAIILQRSGMAITLDWIPAHVSTPGNIAADTAAKAAMVMSREAVHSMEQHVLDAVLKIPRPYPLVHKVARTRSRVIQFDELVNSDPLLRPRLRALAVGHKFPPPPLIDVLKSITKDIKTLQLNPLPRSVEVVLARLRSKTEIRQSVLLRMGHQCDGSCPYCGTHGGHTPEHMICDCVVFGMQRRVLQDALAECVPIVSVSLPDLVGFGSLTRANAPYALTALSVFLTTTNLTERLTVVPQPAPEPP